MENINIPENAKEIISELAIMGLDKILEKTIQSDNEILKEIPIIKSIVSAIQIGSAIQNAHFIKKYACFIGIVNENKIDDKLLFDVLKNKKEVKKIIEQTIIEIDRYQTIEKTKMLSLLFVKTFKDKTFSIEEYNILLFGIEAIQSYTGIETLQKYYKAGEYLGFDVKHNEKVKDLDYTQLFGTGLITTPAVSSYFGGADFVAFISKLGIKFYENIIVNL